MEEGVKVLLKLGVAMVSAPPAKKRMFASVLLVTSDTEYIEWVVFLLDTFFSF